ncbi:MBOAT family O-acyltransferase [Arenibaculum sp.]|uniref:MBOAT family O-acyltransferase n=1 Tax=Arenibaculum sp. TaxID=2865862 RepID=UPI002E125284|nr:MBOAT family O-acyltransferase [Arenibaculum sp.]
MLFNSFEFIGWFLPGTVAVFFLLGVAGWPKAAMTWLVVASLFFYGWWNPAYVPLLVSSIGVNYLIGLSLARRPSRLLLVAGIAANLLVLGWYKYAAFVFDSVNLAFGAGLTLPELLLPLAISFFTFQQIAFLVDANAGLTHEKSLLRYSLFVCFFPQLIAGPIVHHKEMLPQFDRDETFRPSVANLSVGLTVFVIGLFKKVVIADSVAPLSTAMFAGAATGTEPDMAAAWIGAVAFSIQLYFDFSGYSDMAIGASRMMGIRLPLNFASPYKAASIIDFWSRWHMTLTRFLTAYVYNPVTMGLTKRRLKAGLPPLRPKRPGFVPFILLIAWPTFLTMALAGVWHGAGWQFVLFGVIHGVLLVLNHAWRVLRHAFGIGPERGRPWRPLGVALTFVAWTVSLVFFKAESVGHAFTVLEGMAGLNGFVLPHPLTPFTWIADAPAAALYMVARNLVLDGYLPLLTGAAIVWLMPNTQEWIRDAGIATTARAVAGPAPGTGLARLMPAGTPEWRPSVPVGLAIGMLFAFTLLQAFATTTSEFLYFTF